MSLIYDQHISHRNLDGNSDLDCQIMFFVHENNFLEFHQKNVKVSSSEIAHVRN